MNSIGYLIGFCGGCSLIPRSGLPKATHRLFEKHDLSPQTRTVISLAMKSFLSISLLALRLSMPQTAFLFSGKCLQGTLIALFCLSTEKSKTPYKTPSPLEVGVREINTGKGIREMLKIMQEATKAREAEEADRAAISGAASAPWLTKKQKTHLTIACIGISVFYFGVPFITVMTTLTAIKSSYALMLALYDAYSKPQVIYLQPNQQTGERVHSLDQTLCCRENAFTVIIENTMYPISQEQSCSISANMKYQILNSSQRALKLDVSYSSPSTIEEVVRSIATKLCKQPMKHVSS